MGPPRFSIIHFHSLSFLIIILHSQFNEKTPFIMYDGYVLLRLQ